MPSNYVAMLLPVVVALAGGCSTPRGLLTSASLTERAKTNSPATRPAESFDDINVRIISRPPPNPAPIGDVAIAVVYSRLSPNGECLIDGLGHLTYYPKLAADWAESARDKGRHPVALTVQV